MTNEERHEARRARREEKRAEKRLKDLAEYDNFDNVTSISKLIQAAYLSRRGTSKKASVQKYMMNLLRNTAQSYAKLLNGNDVREGFIEFNLCERGKKRHIRAMHVKERVIQRCFCDNVAIPVLKRPLVYDNGASLKDKGIHFALDRLKEHLRQYIRQNGTEGYILLVDFSGYFDNIDHDAVYELLQRSFDDERVKRLAWQFVTAFGDKGLGIGSQISQIIAVAYPNRIDHYIREMCRIGLAARYMDDSYVIAKDREALVKLQDEYAKFCEMLGIKLNPKKLRIEKIRKFTFMKARVRITDSGKVLMLPCRKSFARMRRKLRTFKVLLDAGEMTIKQINTSYQSWRGYQSYFDAHRSIRKMDKYYHEIIGLWPGEGI